MSTGKGTAPDRLPRLLARPRRRLLVGLVGTGGGQALLAALTAVAMPLLLEAGPVVARWAAGGALVLGAVALGLLRRVERVQAERLGQHYVQEVRSGLVASSLVERGPALGVTVTRASNDLNSVRNWIALGIAPLCVAAPVLLGTALVLWLLEPLLAFAWYAPNYLDSIYSTDWYGYGGLRGENGNLPSTSGPLGAGDARRYDSPNNPPNFTSPSCDI